MTTIETDLGDIVSETLNLDLTHCSFWWFKLFHHTLNFIVV